MRGATKRHMGFCCAIVLVSIAGCRQIVDFDEPSPDSGVADESKPLPFVPFEPQLEYKETCTSCAAEKCDSQHQACVDDPQCRELLRCYGKCTDPLCIARCGSYDLLDYAWGGGSGPIAVTRGAENAFLSAYQRCVSIYECPNDCGWGLDWGCLDKSNPYRWPSGPYVENSPLHVKLEVLFTDNEGVSALVSAYRPTGTGMEEIRPPKATNAWGQVELEFPYVVDPILQIESTGAIDEFRVLDYSGPFFRDTRLSRTVFPSDFQPVSPQAGFAGVIVAVTDCVGAPAAGITFELEGATGQFSKYAYKGDFDSVDTKTNQLGAGGFTDVSPANATVTVRAKHGEQIVARRTVLLRENWVTSVVLRPLSGDD